MVLVEHRNGHRERETHGIFVSVVGVPPASRDTYIGIGAKEQFGVTLRIHRVSAHELRIGIDRRDHLLKRRRAAGRIEPTRDVAKFGRRIAHQHRQFATGG